jgi:hypothetical protein
VNELDDLDVLERELGPSLRSMLHRVADEIESDATWRPSAAIDHLPTIVFDDRHRDDVKVSTDRTGVGIDTELDSQRQDGGRRWRIVVTAAAVLALVVLALVVDGRDGTEPEVPADPPSNSLLDESMVTALAIVEDFSTAWVAGDGDAIAALFTPGGIIEIGQLPTYAMAVSAPSMMPALHDWFRAAGYEFNAEGCQLVHEAFGVPSHMIQAFCSFTYESDLTRHFDRAPVAVNMWLEMDAGWLAIDAGRGRMLRFVLGSHYFDLDADIGFLFEDWVSTHHPADSARMYRSPGSTAPRVDPTSIELWDRYLDEFTSSAAKSLLADQPRTMAEYGARVRSICARADVRFEKERAASQPGGARLEAAARIGSESLEELRGLQPPETTDQLDEVFSQMEQEITLTAQAAAAWDSGDTERADGLVSRRVNLTHHRGGGGFDFSYCPVNLGA